VHLAAVFKPFKLTWCLEDIIETLAALEEDYILLGLVLKT
jgi:hypothetical protein